MLEMNKEQLLSFDELNRTKILELIAKGIIKYKEKDIEDMIEANMNHIPNIL